MHGAVMSLPTRGAWIEMEVMYHEKLEEMSLPTRGAWIEILKKGVNCVDARVAPHTGSVD